MTEVWKIQESYTKTVHNSEVLEKCLLIIKQHLESFPETHKNKEIKASLTRALREIRHAIFLENNHD